MNNTRGKIQNRKYNTEVKDEATTSKRSQDSGGM